MLYALVLIGISLIIMRIFWGVWVTVSAVEAFMKLPLNQRPELATIIAIGIVSYILVVAKSTHYFSERINRTK
jgi:hypothetical protein